MNVYKNAVVKVLFLVFLCFLVSSAKSQSYPNAPFGFEWGQSQDDLKKKGVSLAGCINDGDFVACEAKNPIKPVSFGDIYLPRFHKTEGLQWVGVLSNRFEDDISGSEGKELYDKVKQSLIKKYKEPDASLSQEVFGLTVYDGYDEFYQCLAYSGCGYWGSLWNFHKDGGGAVNLQLIGLGRGVGRLKIIYESNKWSGLLDEMKEKINSSDDDSL